MAMTTIGERVSYVEGKLDSLATKEDLAIVKSDLMAEFSKIEPRIIKWMLSMVLSSVTIATTLAIFIQHLVE